MEFLHRHSAYHEASIALVCLAIAALSSFALLAAFCWLPIEKLLHLLEMVSASKLPSFFCIDCLIGPRQYHQHQEEEQIKKSDEISIDQSHDDDGDIVVPNRALTVRYKQGARHEEAGCREKIPA